MCRWRVGAGTTLVDVVQDRQHLVKLYQTNGDTQGWVMGCCIYIREIECACARSHSTYSRVKR